MKIIFKLIFLALAVTGLGLLYSHHEKIMPTSPPRRASSVPSLKVQSQQVPCSCIDGGTSLKAYVKKDKFDDIFKRRAEEYKKYKIRKNPRPDTILLAPSNSPLQYPIHGFIVAPLQKSVIPGLSVHDDVEKKNYQVTLSVSTGVLAVEILQERDTVKGQGENMLSISASSLQSLNELLGRVSYTSTVYSIKSEDLVHFSFEEYEAIFPIVIRQPNVPVLYDLGEDINSQVTITTKTFMRYPELHRLITSIRSRYKDIKIIVADDSFNPQKVNVTNVEQYIMPPAQGWFAGRTLAISQVTTKYLLWVDDDYSFTEKTQIEKYVEIMESMPELDVIGGSVGSNAFSFKIKHEEGDEEGGCLSKVRGNYQPIPGIPDCYFTSGVVNFFLARTDAVRKVGFDPQLKRVAHSEFFMDGLGEMLVASCPKFSIGHQPKRGIKIYNQYRHPAASDAAMKNALHFFKNRLKCVKY